MKWEYKKIWSRGLEEVALNKLGLDNWELAGIVNGGCDLIYYFKRAIEAPKSTKSLRSPYNCSWTP